jgi:dTDP-4-dehydrorhamnose 3,5-epimerase
MQSEIEGVYILPMKLIPDERGCVKKIDLSTLRTIEDVYITTVEQGAIKGWHGYHIKTLGFTCIKGKVKLVVWKGEQFEEHFIGDENPVSVWVRPGIYTAFKGIGQENILVIVADEPYEDRGVRRLPPHDNYDWSRKDG